MIAAGDDVNEAAHGEHDRLDPPEHDERRIGVGLIVDFQGIRHDPRQVVRRTAR